MAMTLDDTANSRRDELLERAAAFAAGRKATGGPPGDQSGELLRYFYRHVVMVERMIGTKPGTGGSSGAGYLRSRLDLRYYPLLWQMRSVL